MTDIIHTDNASKPLGAYPHARRVGNLLFLSGICLLYTSDAADERSSVDLGGRRVIKKKRQKKKQKQIKKKKRQYPDDHIERHMHI